MHIRLQSALIAALVALAVGAGAASATSLITGGQIAPHTITQANLATGVLAKLAKTGLDGVPGAAGATGAVGAQGQQGPQGVPGPQGPQGPTGQGIGIPGATGPQGPQGDPGAPGSQGPAGASFNLSNITYVTGASVSISPGGYGSATAVCPKGTQIISGGYTGYGTSVQEDYAEDKTTWYVSSSNNTSSYEYITATEICVG